MCGIIGYCGNENAVPILLSGLHALEYRGYDSAGIAVFEKDGITTVKAKGRISEVEKLISEKYEGLSSNCGIGHTRWATHGEPSDRNSHPHSTEDVTIVHNGIIENYTQVKEFLCGKGYAFVSDTDTETALKLIDYNYKLLGDKFAAIKATVEVLKGSYAFGIIFKDEPNTVYALRKDSPLIAAKGDNGTFIASDIPAVLKYTRSYYRIDENEIAVLGESSIRFFTLDKQPIEKEIQTVTWDVGAAEKGGYDHFMIKEIHEEPDSIIKTVHSRLKDGLPYFDIDSLTDERIKNIGRIHIVACGTAMHAGLAGKFAIEKLARIPVTVDVASEFRYNNPILSKNDIFIAISQSGETADTLAALRMAKAAGLYTLSVVNVVGSSVARESDGVIYTWAGPEIAVASTKAYVVQICILYMLAIRLAMSEGRLTEDKAREYMDVLLKEAPAAVEKVLEKDGEIRSLAEKLKDANDIFFIGRGVDSCLAQEASLKLKEVSYIHSEAYAAGELKHGTISLIVEGVPVIAIATESKLYEKTISNIKECKARGASSLLICDETFGVASDVATDILRIPHIDELFMPIPTCCAFQMIAYYTAVLRGCDVDKPRNLAKSVTVE